MATLCWHCWLYVFFGPVSEAFQLISSSSLHLFPLFFWERGHFPLWRIFTTLPRLSIGQRVWKEAGNHLLFGTSSLSLVNTRSLLIIRIFFSSLFSHFWPAIDLTTLFTAGHVFQVQCWNVQVHSEIHRILEETERVLCKYDNAGEVFENLFRTLPYRRSFNAN